MWKPTASADTSEVPRGGVTVDFQVLFDIGVVCCKHDWQTCQYNLMSSHPRRSFSRE